jgi:hypothetical protein
MLRSNNNLLLNYRALHAGILTRDIVWRGTQCSAFFFAFGENMTAAITGKKVSEAAVISIQSGNI